MQQFNVNRPMSMSDLAQLHASGGLNTLGQNASSYADQQASRLGLGGVSSANNYFSGLRANTMNQAAATQGRQMELARLAGQPVGGFDTQRNAQIDAATAQQRAQAAQVASLQQQQRETNYPLGAQLRPLDMDEARRLEQTPEAYTLNKRLGTNATTMVGGQQRSWVNPQGGQADPATIYQHPQFRVAMQQSPEHAATVFRALTGLALHGNSADGSAGFADTYNKQQAETVKYGTDYLRKAATDGLIRRNPETKKYEWRKRVPNLTTGGLQLSSEYDKGDAFQQSQLKYMPLAFPDMDEFDKHAKARDDGDGVAGLQPQAAEDDTIMGRHARSISPLGYIIGETLYNGIPKDTINLLRNTKEGINTMTTNAAVGLTNLLGLSNEPASRPVWWGEGVEPMMRQREAMQSDKIYQALRIRNPAAARQYVIDKQNQGR